MVNLLGKNGRVTVPEKERRFAERYLILGNASQAAREAGFAPKSAHVTGSKLLKRPRVQEYLRALAEKRRVKEENNPTAEMDLQTRILRELELMAFANIQDFITIGDDGKPQVDFSTATREQLAAITSIVSKDKVTRARNGDVTREQESRFNMADKYRGLDALGRHIGMFKPDEQRVVIDVADRLLAARLRYKALTNGEAE